MNFLNTFPPGKTFIIWPPFEGIKVIVDFATIFRSWIGGGGDGVLGTVVTKIKAALN